MSENPRVFLNPNIQNNVSYKFTLDDIESVHWKPVIEVHSDLFGEKKHLQIYAPVALGTAITMLIDLGILSRSSDDDMILIDQVFYTDSSILTKMEPPKQ